MTEYHSPLAEEVLTDVAQTFFGARRKLDDMIDILKEYAEVLEQKAAVVIRRAGTLNYLLVEENRSLEFYEAVGVADPGELPRCDPPDPPALSFARVFPHRPGAVCQNGGSPI